MDTDNQDKEESKISGKGFNAHNVEIFSDKNFTYHIHSTIVFENFKILELLLYTEFIIELIIPLQFFNEDKTTSEQWILE